MKIIDEMPNFLVVAIRKLKAKYDNEYKALVDMASSVNKKYVSVTSLIDTPLPKRLNPNYVDTNLYAFIGTGLHLAAGAGLDDYINEVRFTYEFGEWILGGKIDVYDIRKKILYDIKKMSKYFPMPKDEYLWQLKVNRYLLEKNGIEVKDMAIVGIFTDFNQSDHYDDRIKIKSQVCQYFIDYDEETTRMYIEGRLMVHDNPDYICSDSERWLKADYAIIKPGSSRAFKTFENYSEIDIDYLQSMLSKGYELLYREKEFKRCTTYCEARKICPHIREPNTIKIT